MLKVYDKIILENEYRKKEIMKDNFCFDDYINHVIKGRKKIVEINNNSIIFDTDDEREKFLKLLDKVFVEEDNNNKLKIYNEWILNIDYEPIGQKLNKEIVIRKCEDVLKIPKNTRILSSQERYIIEYNENRVIFDKEEERNEFLNEFSLFNYDDSYSPRELVKQ